MADPDSADYDMCPVCKSTPLTTPGLRFKIAPRCYHRICEGCVDRKFSSGKTECPISGCKQQLWKRDWKTQTFEDLQIEREVDLRRYVFGALSKDENDFTDKRYYDDFLELREELVMNLVFNTDVRATRRKIEDYKELNGLSKPKLDEAGKPLPKQARPKTEDEVDPSGLIKGLRKKIVPVAEKPYDPFMGMPRAREYYELRPSLPNRWEHRKKDIRFDAGGYDLQAYMDESLLRAFSGLGVFIDDETPLNASGRVSSNRQNYDVL